MAVDSDLNVNINIKQTGGASLSNLAGGIANLGRVAATAAIGGLAIMGTAVAAVSAKLISMGSDAQEMQGKFDVVMGEFAGPVTQQLATFAGEVGRSRFELMGFSATIQDTLVPLGFARGAAADMSVEVVKLATDLASFNNLDTQMVIEDIQSALVGNTETLRKYGVVASQTAIEQYAINEGLWDGKDAMDAQTKAAAIMGLIMDGTADAQGDAARTSESFANQMRALQASITDTATEIGLGLLPVVEPLLAMLSNLANNVLQWLMDKFSALQPILAQFGAALDWFNKGEFDRGWTLLGQAINNVMEALGFNEEQREAFKTYWDELGKIISDENVPAFLRVGDAIVFTMDAMGISEETQGKFAAFWGDLYQILISNDTAMGKVGDTIDLLMENLGVSEEGRKRFSDWWDSLGGDSGEGEGSVIGRVLSAGGKFVLWVAGELLQTITDMIEMADSVSEAYQTITNKIQWLKDNGGGLWTPIKNDAINALNAILGVISSINGMIDSLIEKLALLNGMPSSQPMPPGWSYDPNNGGFTPPPDPYGGGTGGTNSSSGYGGQPSSQSNNGPSANSPTYVMNVYGGDVGSMQSEFGAMQAAAGAI